MSFIDLGDSKKNDVCKGSGQLLFVCMKTRRSKSTVPGFPHINKCEKMFLRAWGMCSAKRDAFSGSTRKVLKAGIVFLR
jgi:hypothetical protein